jgi:OOP family OmpA-OmpF porin
MKLNKKQKVALIIGGVVLIGIAYMIYRKRKKDENVGDEQNESKVLKDVFDNLTFETNKDVIKPASFPYLDELAETLKSAQNWTLKIIGHTDNVGKDAFNLDLSMRRANSVKKYLVEKGVSDSIISTEGKGETMPIASNDTKEGRAKNRRVEFVITKPNNVITTTTM